MPEFWTLLWATTLLWIVVLIVPRIVHAYCIYHDVDRGLNRAYHEIVSTLALIEAHRQTADSELNIDLYEMLTISVSNHVYYTDKVATRMIYPILYFWMPPQRIQGFEFQERCNAYSLFALNSLVDKIEETEDVSVLPLRTEILRLRNEYSKINTR